MALHLRQRYKEASQFNVAKVAHAVSDSIIRFIVRRRSDVYKFLPVPTHIYLYWPASLLGIHVWIHAVSAR